MKQKSIVGISMKMKTNPAESSFVGSRGIKMPSLSDSMAKELIMVREMKMKMPNNKLPITFSIKFRGMVFFPMT